MAPKQKARARFEGTADQLALVVTPFVRSSTWLRYSEKASAKLEVASISRHGELVRALLRVQQNLSFTKVVMEQAMRHIVKRRVGDLRIKEEYWQEWARVQACRLRVLCRHVANSNTKARKPAWLSALLRGEGHDDADAGKDEGEEEEARAEDPETDPNESEGEIAERSNCDIAGERQTVVRATSLGGYFVGWDVELRCGWRSKMGSKSAAGAKAKEASRNFVLVPGNPFVHCKWPDGMIKEIQDQTWTDLDRSEEAEKEVARKNKNIEWSGTQISSVLPVTLGWRADRQPLLSIYLAGSQKCQVPLG